MSLAWPYLHFTWLGIMPKLAWAVMICQWLPVVVLIIAILLVWTALLISVFMKKNLFTLKWYFAYKIEWFSVILCNSHTAKIMVYQKFSLIPNFRNKDHFSSRIIIKRSIIFIIFHYVSLFVGAKLPCLQEWLEYFKWNWGNKSIHFCTLHSKL